MAKRNEIELYARYLAEHCVRNTFLEDLHSGITPSSKTGDFSDVKVVTPYGELSWTEDIETETLINGEKKKGYYKVSRISDKEMRKLMLEVETTLIEGLRRILGVEKGGDMIIHLHNNKKVNIDKTKFIRTLKQMYANGVSWDRNEN